MTLKAFKETIWFKYADIMVLYDNSGTEINPTTQIQWKRLQRKNVSSHSITHKDGLVILNVHMDVLFQGKKITLSGS